MRIFYLMIGFISVELALLGVALPLLPTPPFCCWRLHAFHALPTDLKNGYTILSCIKSMWRTFAKQVLLLGSVKERKILISIYILTGISIFFAPLIWMKFALAALTLFMTYYLFKVIPDKE